MEPFIQLNYAEQCHRKPSTPKETPFVDNTKVPELFWIDLLEKKCVEGLGEVSEHLANDENLMPDDFLGDQLLSPLNSGLEGSGEKCCRSRKSVDYQRFKTPLALKCVHKSVETPCLFSQDESVNTTPISGQQCNEHARTQSSPTCVGDTQFVHESPSTFQVLYTPAALSRHRSVGGLSEKSTKTPDLLADIMGQGRTSLSCLLAESEDQEIAEWTESMATPPLKIARSAADETGGNEEAEGNVEEDEECQPSTKRIVRVLFSGSSTNQSWEPLELSSDGVVTNKQSLNLSNGEDANGETEHQAETRDDTSIHEEFLVEYSCYSDSKYPHQDVPESAHENTLVASPSVNTCGRSKSSYCGENVISTPLVNTCKPQYFEQSPNPKLLDSQFPGDVLSPSCVVPLRALAQSTPKPSIQGSARFGSWQNGLAIEEPDASLCGRHVLTDSPSRSCEKTVVRALCDVTSHTEANCKLDSSRVMFGSPSRSFELAMAHETDKLSSGEEQGSSLSSCSQSPRSEHVLNTTARSQSTKASRETSDKATRQSTEGGQSNQLTEITTTAITLNQATITTPGNPIIQTSRSETKTWSPSNPANEISSGLVNGHDSLIRRKSFCKAPGLRRSAGTKRFLYPAASQVSKEDTGKHFREENTNNRSWCEEAKAPLTNGNGVTACETNLDDKTVCNMNCDQSGENEFRVAKKLRVDEKQQDCCREKQINGAEKDDVLFDMDTLSQFPVDCIMSQPASICDSDSLYVDTSPPMEQHQLNVTYTITKDETRGIGETIDPVTTSVEDEARASFNGKIMKKSEKEEGEDEGGSGDFLTINCRASVTFSATTETESNNLSSSYLVKSKDKKAVVDLSNPSTFGPVDSDGIIPEFVGFHTASGRRVSVSLEALAKAKATMEEVDSLLSLNNRLNEDPAEKSKSEVPSAPSEVGTSCKPTAISNMDVNHSSSKMLDFEVQKVPAFCGFSTASGKQVYVSEAALKQAKKTLSELDVELKIKSSEQSFEATTVDREPFGRVSALESEVGSVSDFQEVPHVSSGENLTTSVDEMKKIRECRADILNRCEIECKRFEFSSRPDHSNRNLCQAYTPSGVHTNSLRTTAVEDSVIETKNAENVNDSLLEDLLNDCKKKRRHSMETISEEKERNAEKISDSSRTERNFELNDLLSITDYREGLDHWENITAEPCPDVASRDKGKPNSVPGSKSALRESENIANKIDDERTISEEQITDRESVNGIDVAVAVKDLESYLIVGKRNEHQVEAGDLVDGKNKPLEFRTATGKAVEISEDSLEAAISTITKINDEVLSEWQKDSKDDLSSSCDFESAFKETEKRCEERSQTLKETMKKANENVSNESHLKRGVVSFSGFHTAGGKKISLSEEALKAGREIMKRLSEDASEDSLGRRNETSPLLCTTGRCRLVGAENPSVYEHSPESELTRRANRSLSNTVRINRQVHTGAYPSTEYPSSEAADDGSKPSDFSGFQTTPGKPIHQTKEALQKGAMNLQQIDESLEHSENKTGPNNGFSGFQTAAGNIVKLSKESLENGAAIMQQIDSSVEDSFRKTRPSAADMSGFCDIQTASERSVYPSPDSSVKGTAILHPMNASVGKSKKTLASNTAKPPRFADFKTAATLEKGATIMQQIDRSLVEGKDENLSGSRSGIIFSGFQTAQGRSVPISNESLDKGAAITQQTDKSPEEAFLGFRTANGQSVQLSTASLEKGAAIMRQIDRSLEDGKGNSMSTLPSEKGFAGLRTANGQSVQLSTASLEKGAAIMRQIDRSLAESKGNGTPISPSTTGFSGFRTGNGKSVQLSKESLEKGAALMRQIDRSFEEGMAKSLSTSSRKTGFSGFRTANGQSVKLSKESLEKGAAIIRQIDKSLEESMGNNAGHDTRCMAGVTSFQTARGQSAILSKELPEKGRATMQQIDKSLEEKNDNSVSCSRSATGFSGFQTASGQSVQLSKTSLEKGAKIMQEIDKSLEVKADSGDSRPSNCIALSGFQTGAGKTVQISESTLANAKETIAGIQRELCLVSPRSGDLGCEIVAEVKNTHAGSNARGQRSTVENTDNSALVVSNTDDANFKGFFTAGGQRVSVSEDALAKARKFIQETDTDLSNSKTEQGTDASLHECTVAPVSVEAHDKSAGTTERNLSLEHDEVVSREILESSEALLADETIMEVAEYLHDKQERSAVGLKSLDRLRPGGPLLKRKTGISATEAASGSKPDFSRRHSAPLQCSEDVRANNHAVTRNGLKPQIATPSGILNDRRSRSFHVPLRARYSSYENIRSSGSSRRYNDTDTDLKTSSKSSDCNRYLRPLQSLSPACFKSKTVPLPRTSTPVHSATNRRASGPRPQFITPYRKHQATKDTSPLVRCSSTSGVAADHLLEDHVSAVNEPSPKKPRLSVVNGMSYTVGSDFGDASKAQCKTRPQPGFLSQVRHCNQRIKLRELVGNSTPGGFSAAELIALGVSPDLLSFTSSNAKSFRFDGKSYFSGAFMSSKEGVRTEDGGLLHVGTDGCVGLEEIQSAFLSTPGVDKELINEEWITNHYRWIIWKLAAMEVAFPRLFAGRCLTPDWALCQLKYRYDREIDNSHRSALKKILERDDVSSRTMVLCVSSVSVSDKEPEGVAQEKKDQDGKNDTQVVAKKTEPMCAVIELTDGWYGIRGLLDRPLTRLLKDRKLGVGQKLCINGAELVGSDQAVSPLEAPSSLMLRLTANSTRRARWDAKLGFHRYTRAFPLPLTSLFGDGGFTGCVDVIVLRQYPVQWMEKMPDGTNVFRNSRLEEREAKRFEVDRHQRREKLFLKIQEDFEKEFRQPELERRRSVRLRRRPVSPCDLKELHDGKEIYEALTQASDPDVVREYLDESQVRALEDYRRLLQERKCAELQSKFERLWKEQEAESQLQRNVVPLLKVRITDYFLKGQAKQNAMLSIWRPSEEVMQLLSEGFRLRIYHLTAGGVRFRQGASELQLSATRTTRYELLPSEPDVLRPSYMPRQVCCFDELRCSSTQQFSEVDIVGLVVFCSPLSCFSTSSSSVQTVYLSDAKCNLVAIKFWGGLKAVAVEDLVKPRSFICCSNLTVRPDDRLQCPSLTFSELSSLTLKPRELHLRTALDKLQQNIPDLDLFMARIQNTLTSFRRPHRPSSSTKIKLNTVRMYGNSTIATPSDWMQKHDSSKILNTEELRDEENNSNFNDEEGRPAGVVQSVVSDRDTESTQKPLVPSCEGQTTLAMTRALSRQAKRKLLDNIAEPPPLSPLLSPIPVSVRREFKRPRRVGSPANVPLEQ